MTISRPAYCTREQVMRSLDIKFTARMADAVDRAIESAADNIDGHLHRKFYPEDKTLFWDWPNYQSAYPWRIWFDQSELAAIPTASNAVQTGGTTIPLTSCLWGPWNYSPPYTYLELNRSTTAAFGVGSTPQRDVSITGTFGYWTKTNPAGTLAAAVTDTTGTSVTLSSSALAGVGDVLVVDTERFLVTDKTMTSTAQTQQGAGAGTASAADVSLTVTDGTKYAVNEVLLLDSERMLVVDLSGNVLTVKRAWDGTVLATHAGATIYAPRVLTVTRGDLGSTAATHSNAATALTSRIPPIIRDLAIAEAGNQVLEETGGYSDPQGEEAGMVRGLGTALADKWDEAETRYGRKARVRVI